MCGIAGYFNRSKKAQGLKEIAAMIEMEEHRGPNDRGFFGIDFSQKTGKEVFPEEEGEIQGSFNGFLGFCRLSIRDLSDNGHQPMADSEKKAVLVFNGEIYNADIYRKELTEKGYIFRGGRY